MVPLVTNARAHSTGADLEILNQIAGRERSDPTPAELQKLGIYNNDVSRLIALRERLHSKKIRAIEFRGCNLGRSPRSVRAFCSFFGAVRLGAPQLHSFFGDPAVLHGPGVVDSHEAGHRGDRTYSYTYPSGSADACVVLVLIWPPSARSTDTSLPTIWTASIAGFRPTWTEMAPWAMLDNYRSTGFGSCQAQTILIQQRFLRRFFQSRQPMDSANTRST